MTRPIALRPEQHRPLIDALTAGATYRDAVGSVGIPWPTWCSWTKAVREGKPVDPKILALVTQARAAYHKATTVITAQVRVAAAKDWRAAAFLLDHRRGAPKAKHDEKRARWEAEIAESRAKGTHTEKVEVTGDARAALTKLLDRAAGDAQPSSESSGDPKPDGI